MSGRGPFFSLAGEELLLRVQNHAHCSSLSGQNETSQGWGIMKDQGSNATLSLIQGSRQLFFFRHSDLLPTSKISTYTMLLSWKKKIASQNAFYADITISATSFQTLFFLLMSPCIFNSIRKVVYDRIRWRSFSSTSVRQRNCSFMSCEWRNWRTLWMYQFTVSLYNLHRIANR